MTNGKKPRATLRSYTNCVSREEGQEACIHPSYSLAAIVVYLSMVLVAVSKLHSRLTDPDRSVFEVTLPAVHSDCN